MYRMANLNEIEKLLRSKHYTYSVIIDDAVRVISGLDLTTADGIYRFQEMSAKVVEYSLRRRELEMMHHECRFGEL